MLDPSISYPHHGESPTGGAAAVVVVSTQQLDYHQSRTDRRSSKYAMATCYPTPYELSPQTQRTVQVPPPPPVQKDYTRPLHVDCSVEYELPNTAKPPQGVRNEPLLMIHPCYFRKIESQRRSPFVNNLPARQQTIATTAAVVQQQQQQQQQPQQTSGTAASITSAATVIAASTTGTSLGTTSLRPRRSNRPQQPQAQSHYPLPYAAAAPSWDQMPPLVPITQSYKSSTSASACTAYSSSSTDSGHWTDPDRSPDRPDDTTILKQHQQQHILTGKYRQYLRAHRLHPYVTSAIPLASTFPQIQQVCYNV